jgi:hypothetical protein
MSGNFYTSSTCSRGGSAIAIVIKAFSHRHYFLHIHDHINSFAFLRKYTFVSMYRVTFLSACNDARQLIHKTKYDTCFHATSVFVITEIGIGRV